MNKLNDIEKCLKCRFGEDNTFWHYNEVPKSTRTNFLIRYKGGYGNLVYTMAICIPFQETTFFKQQTEAYDLGKGGICNPRLENIDSLPDNVRWFFRIENGNEIILKLIHSWAYLIDVIRMIDDGK